jgi:hypothetical protein
MQAFVYLRLSKDVKEEEDIIKQAILIHGRTSHPFLVDSFIRSYLNANSNPFFPAT